MQPVQAQPAPVPALAALRVEAVQAPHADGQDDQEIEADQAPATGWRQVSLPDMWGARWPDFDGVVWYRVHWNRGPADQAAALAIDYLNMAGAIYVNGNLLGRDANLTEPLSRAWNLPRYYLLPSALLHPGDNVVDIRVSGQARHQAGLGRIAIGAPGAVGAKYEKEHWLRVQSQWFCLAIVLTIGCFFSAMWLMRRQAAVNGWFALTSLAWWMCTYNQIAYSPWPFSTSDAWEAANTAFLLLFNASFTMFVLRFSAQRRRRYEMGLWTCVVLGCLGLWLAPASYLAPLRVLLTSLQSLHYIAVSLVFTVFAWRNGRADHRILALFLSLAVVAAVHDTLMFVGISWDNIYLTPLSVVAEMVCMALILGWQFVVNLRRIERFNNELKQAVEQARSELTQTLQRQHELEIDNTRLGARLNLAQDLHDGLGGTLVSSIVTLERAPQDMPPQRFLAVLKELRDDLRIIIDSSTNQQYGATTLDGQLSPFRHRLTRQAEAHGIECRWHLSGIDTCTLAPASCLELMRVLQEALTNVFRHSQASRVDVEMRHEFGSLKLTVRDNGIGFPEPGQTGHHGTGLISMRARVTRVGGTLDIRSAPGATSIEVLLRV